MSTHELRIGRLELRNFKGIKEFDLEISGADAAILGDNATGKTTLDDAFCWLMFGHDSQGRAEFEIKTLDENGEPTHHVEHSVSADLILHGGVTKNLRRVFKEKWVKKRGQADRTLQGHTTDYFIDGVPVKATEFNTEVAEMAEGETFQLLTNPMQFSDRMHWQDRRQVLLEVCGDVTDEEVIGSTEELAELPEILDGKTLDARRRILKAGAKKVNTELERLPIRIDEVTRGLPDVPKSGQEATARVASLREQRDEVAAKKEALINGEELGVAKLAYAGKYLVRTELLVVLRSEADASVKDAHDKSWVLEQAQHDAEVIHKRIVRDRDEWAVAVALDDERVEKARMDWEELDATEFEEPPEQDENCPTCGQSMPASLLAGAVDEARDAFNLEKSEKLETLADAGEKLAAAVTGGKERLEKDLGPKVADAVMILGRANKAVDDFDEPTTAEPNLEDDRYVAALADMEKTAARVTELEAGSAPDLIKVADVAQQIDLDLMDAEQAVARIEQRTEGEARIEELKADERKLAGEYEELERQLFLTERFIKQKVAMLEQRINSRFKLARFVLFREQLNGALEEVAETMFGGVPWKSLNHGARIQIGLDIITTLQEHYGFAPPVWVDQAESVTWLPEMRCQLLRLVVDSESNELRVLVGQEAAS